jgi:hypothetical protein
MTIKGLEAKLVAKKGKLAEIEIEGPEGVKQKITVPAEYLPASIEIGGHLNLYLTNSQEGTLQEKKLAKAILEEILNGQ